MVLGYEVEFSVPQAGEGVIKAYGPGRVPITSGSMVRSGTKIDFEVELTTPSPTGLKVYEYVWFVNGSEQRTQYHEDSNAGKFDFTPTSDINVMLDLIPGYTLDFNATKGGGITAVRDGAPAPGTVNNGDFHREGSTFTFTATDPSGMSVFSYVWTSSIGEGQSGDSNIFPSTGSSTTFPAAGLKANTDVQVDFSEGKTVTFGVEGSYDSGEGGALTAERNGVSFTSGGVVEDTSVMVFTAVPASESKINRVASWTVTIDGIAAPANPAWISSSNAGALSTTGDILTLPTPLSDTDVRIRFETVSIRLYNDSELLNDESITNPTVTIKTLGTLPIDVQLWGSVNGNITPTGAAGTPSAVSAASLPTGLSVASITGGVNVNSANDGTTGLSYLDNTVNVATVPPNAPYKIDVTLAGIEESFYIDIDLPFFNIVVQPLGTPPDDSNPDTLDTMRIDNNKPIGKITVNTNAPGSWNITPLPPLPSFPNGGISYNISSTGTAHEITFTGVRPEIGSASIIENLTVTISKGTDSLNSGTFSLNVTLTPPPKIDTIAPSGTTITTFTDWRIHGSTNTPTAAPGYPVEVVDATFIVTGENFIGNEQEVIASISLDTSGSFAIPTWLTPDAVSVVVNSATTATVTIPLIIGPNRTSADSGFNRDGRNANVRITAAPALLSSADGITPLNVSQVGPIWFSTTPIEIASPDDLIKTITAPGSWVIDAVNKLDLPSNVNPYLNFTVNPGDAVDPENTIRVTATRPVPPDDDINETVTVPITRDGITTNLTLILNITALDKPDVMWPEGLSATYGDLLGSVILEYYSGVEEPPLSLDDGVGYADFTKGGVTVRVPGIFEWDAPSNAVGNAGTRKHSMIFKPSDSDNFASVPYEAEVDVTKAVPILPSPVNLTAIFGQTLSQVLFTGVSATFNNGVVVSGTFEWINSADFVDNVIDSPHTYYFNFIPDDAGNFERVDNHPASVTVNKATPVPADIVVTLPGGPTHVVPWEDGVSQAADAIPSSPNIIGLIQSDIVIYYSHNGAARTTVPPIFPGTVVVTVDIVENNNYNAVSNLFTGTFTIDGIPIDGVSATGIVDKEFDGNYHQISVTVPGGGNIYYSTVEGGLSGNSWSAVGVNPQFRDVIDTKVFFKIERPGTGYNPFFGDVDVKITPKQLEWAVGSDTTKAQTNNKTYDGNTIADVQDLLLEPTLSGVVCSNVSVNVGSVNFVDKNVNSIGTGVVATNWGIEGPGAGNYIAPTNQPLFENAYITPKQLTWNADGTVNNKPYDGGNAATVLSAPTLDGVVDGDTVTVSNATVTFNSINSANGIGIIASGWNTAIAGSSLVNYDVPVDEPVFAVANITPIILTWNADGAVNNKTYDRTNTATVATVPSLDGLLFGDTVSVTSGSVVFNSVNASAIAIPIIANGWSISGNSNYSAPTAQPVFSAALINARQLTWNRGSNISNPATVNSKEFDSTTTATVLSMPTLSTTPSATGIISGDTVTVVPATVNFSNSNAGLRNVITTPWAIDGTSASNYIAPTEAPVFNDEWILERQITGTVVIVISGGAIGVGGSITDGTELEADISNIIGIPGGGGTSGDAVSLGYQWYADGNLILGAQSKIYEVDFNDGINSGSLITVVVIGTTNYTGNIISSSVEIGKIPLNGSISITGIPEVEQLLALNTVALDPVSAEYTIQWLRDGMIIGGATASTYTVTQNDLGKIITVEIIGTGDFTGSLSAFLIIDPIEPNAPLNFTATPGIAQVFLSWSEPDFDGGSAVIKYNLLMSEDGGDTWDEIIQPMMQNINLFTAFNMGLFAPYNASPPTTYTVLNLTNGNEYMFRVHAENDVGEGTHAENSATPFAPPQVVSITPTSETVALFSNVSSDGVAGQAVFNVAGQYLTEQAVLDINIFSILEFPAWVLPSGLSAEFIDSGTAIVTVTLSVLPNTETTRSGSIVIGNTITSAVSGSLFVSQEDGTLQTATETTAYRVTILNSQNGTVLPVGQSDSVRMFEPGTSVSLVAGTCRGYSFINWSSDSNGVVIDNAENRTTSFMMPANDVIITVNWSEQTSLSDTEPVILLSNDQQEPPPEPPSEQNETPASPVIGSESGSGPQPGGRNNQGGLPDTAGSTKPTSMVSEFGSWLINNLWWIIMYTGALILFAALWYIHFRRTKLKNAAASRPVDT
ncbi:MAG: YDG domain-containing protein [Oscillospiraceae bacterium]|nr:YDG domain-containing protein [Oscillospiraceae bacterium]